MLGLGGSGGGSSPRKFERVPQTGCLISPAKEMFEDVSINWFEQHSKPKPGERARPCFNGNSQICETPALASKYLRSAARQDLKQDACKNRRSLLVG
jgi:hypothetical protein